MIDYDWADEKYSRKYSSSLIIALNGAVDTKLSKKKTFRILHSTETEYVALSLCCKNLARLLFVFEELEIKLKPSIIYEYK